MSFLCVHKDLIVKRFLRRAADALARNRKYGFFHVEQQHSLQVQVPEAKSCPDRSSRERRFLFTSFSRWQASFTIEAALAMTLFLFAVMALLSFFFVIRTEIQVQTALEQTGNQLANMPESASGISAALLFQEKLLVNQADVSQIVGGRGGISLSQSTVMGHQPVVDLVAVYRVKLPFFPDQIAGLNIIQRSRKQAFGEAAFLSASKEEYVYVTPSGTVYHKSLYCTYIRPKTEEVKFAEVADRRNGNGEVYTACSFCGTGEAAVTVWITEWGDCYHLSEYCRGIWHDVKQILLTEVEGRNPCSKCGKDDVE